MARTRAYRRHQMNRAKNKAKTLYTRYESHPIEKTPKQIGFYARTKKPCSCVMCGNPRKWFGEKSRQELKQDLI